MNITRQRVCKVLKVVDAGLTNGMGSPIPGKMCVEAAVCYAFGLPHTDQPPCVASTLRNLNIMLNDCKWSSDKTRAKGMRKLAVLQLGTSGFFTSKQLAEFHGAVANLSDKLHPKGDASQDDYPGHSYCRWADRFKSPATRTKHLAAFAEGVAQILIKMKVPGVKWLGLLK